MITYLIYNSKGEIVGRGLTCQDLSAKKRVLLKGLSVVEGVGNPTTHKVDLTGDKPAIVLK